MPSGRVSISEPPATALSSDNELNSRFQVDKVDGLRPDDDDGDVLAPSQYTYVYDTKYGKSFSQLTREALPKLDNYRDLASVHAGYRPTLDELHNATFHEKPAKDVEEGKEPVLKGKVVKFGWLEGVFMRCLLNIWGVIMFLRLSLVVGHAGILQTIAIITLSNVVTVITSISMSAVSTNGQIKGGGIYYMISRSLGPEAGAAIGLMFTVANSIAVSLYIVGFCESLQDFMAENEWGEIIDGGANDIRVVGLGVVVVIMIIAFIGMDWVTRAQMALLVVLIASQVCFVIGSIMGPKDDDERAKGNKGYDMDTFKNNLWQDYREEEGTQLDFFGCFGIFFPAVTGIVAGANLSGDLKDPASSIPKGTLLAIAFTYVTYIIYGIMMGATAIRGASGNVTQYLLTQQENSTVDFIRYDDCDNQECSYGLYYSGQVMGLISAWSPLVYAGCWAATLSSAIASLVGAPRVFQALAKDKIYPMIHFFAKGYGANNDPVRGYVLVFIISVGCLIIAKINVIAPLLSNFFLAAYCLINFAVFHASITKSPGWRPAFKFYNAWVSLIGCLACACVMFLINWPTALITVVCAAALYMFVAYRKPDINWGSSTQAQSFNSALKSVQDLNRVEEHVKNYRPQILVFTGMPSSRPPLVDFSYLIVKNISLMICGHVGKGPYSQKVRNALSKQAYSWFVKHNKRAFYTYIEEENFERGCKSIMQLAGLGKLKPNMVLMGYKETWRKCNGEELAHYFNVIHEALDMHLSFGMLRAPGGLNYSNVIEDEESVERIMEADKEQKPIPRNQSQGQLSQDGTSSDSSSPPSSPKQDRISKPSDDTKTDIAAQKKKRTRKLSSSAMYMGRDGEPLSRNVISNLTQFQKKHKNGVIDVWWLYDDGGLTLLIPYILTTRSQFQSCKLRVFSLSNRKDELGQDQRNMAALLAKFRIDYSDVIVIPDIAKKADPATKKKFDALIEPLKDDNVKDGTKITSDELVTLREKTNRHQRLHELLNEHSKNSSFVFMTLPMPRKGTVSAPLYMAWLELMTLGMPPFLFVRGNQTSVLTFYS